ncbi:hypothetical protein [Terriglobus saanensis]|uniref:hypothetical protein n=1 Tax=Terriglobus saanensis TaxID=870903 RepID=UPI0003245B0A|nr:hypothetical protein [Terriglobus saanensis]
MIVVLAVFAFAAKAIAESIPVRHNQKPMHRFMVARSDDGKTIASGEFTQVVHGSQVMMRLTYRFGDGSIDDEETTYTQGGTFRLVSNHHLQKGPFFTKPVDFTVHAATGTVTFRSVDRDGKVHDQSKHMALPADLANGMVGTLLLNVPHDTAPFRVGMLAAVGGGRLVHLEVSPQSDQTVQLGGQTFQATVFRVHPVLGSIVSLFARMIGLQPKDVTVWVLEGDDPAVAVVIGQLGGYGPVVSSDLVGTDFAK